ncbi:MAG: hypothetical protein ACJ8C9_11305 [Microvirga sp.]
MADNDPTDVATLEAEVAAARARFARTLDRLTDPATHDAMKNEVMERVEGYKDGLLGSVEASARAKGQGVVDDLKTRAMNNPAGAALIGAGIAYHLYRHPPITTLLVGAGTALLMRARGKRSSDPTAYRAPYDEKQPRGYVPGGVAGYGYPVEEDAPGSTTTDRIMAEAAAAGDRARALASEVGERAREIGGRAREAAAEAGSRIAETAERTRHAAADTLDRTRSTAEDIAARARPTAHDAYERTAGAAEDAYERAGDAYDRVRTDPWLLGALGIAAGAALAVAMRRTETGERFVGATTDMVGRGARGVGSTARSVGSTARAAASRAADAASSVTESLGNAASSVTSAASGLAGSVAETWSSDSEPEPPRRGRGGQRRHSGSAHRGRDGDGDFMGSAAEAASSAYRGAAEQADYAARRAAGFAGWARDEVVDLAENYPLLLGAIGLAAGAAAGLALRPTESEDELIGSYSDSLKSRARALATEQYQEVVGAAQDLADAFAEPSGGQSPGADPAADWETVIGGGAPQQGGQPGAGMGGPKV